MYYRDGKDYELHAFTIMSNHVHLVVTMKDGVELPDMLQSLKARTSKKCNQVLGRKGEFWMHEGYDHVVRRGKLGRGVAYVLRNPIKAGIVKHWREHEWTYLSPELHGFD
jgi:REP element-mobilizing transposase RayT